MTQRELSFRPRCAPCNSRNRSASRSRTSTALIAAMRAAASSMPSGSPSRFADLGHRIAVSGSASPKSGRTTRARSTNSVTASEVTPPSSASGATVGAASPSIAKGSREVARTLTSPDRPRIAAIGGRGRSQDVLAVVDDEQEPPSADRLGHRVDERHVALRRDAQHGRDGRGDGGRVTDPCQLDDPHPVDELAGELGADLEGQAGLADTADAGQRDQAVRPHELGDVVDHLLATDE